MNKAAALAEAEANEQSLKLAIQRATAEAEASGATVDEEEPAQRSWFCGLFPVRRQARTTPKPPREQSATAARVFGAKRGGVVDATERLGAAAASVRLHAETLATRASQAREKARDLALAGDRAAAVLALKRAKALEKQAEVAGSTQLALEHQIDVLEASHLQREVASALSASVGATKQKTRGLLAKAETAVEDSVEMKDLADEVSQVLGEMQPGDAIDEDELNAELNELVNSQRETAPTACASVEAPSVGTIVGKFPSVPARRYVRLEEEDAVRGVG